MTGFCEDCPDHEACATAHPCDYVKMINAEHQNTTFEREVNDNTTA